MAIQVGVGSFRYNTLGGTVTFVDQDGAAFVPEYLFLMNQSSLNNTLYSNGTGNFNTWSWNQSLVRCSDFAAVCMGNAENPQFSAKICSGGAGSGLNCTMNSFESDVFFGGQNYRYGKITAVGSGFFTYLPVFDSNYFTTDFIFFAIRGILLEPIATPSGAGSYATPHTAKGVWQTRMGGWSSAVANPASGAGGANNGWGWDSPNIGPFHVGTLVENQGGNYRYISPSTYNATIGSVGPTVSIGGKVTAWNPSTITVNAGASTLYIIGGTNVLTASGSFNLNNSIGNQTFDTFVWPKLLMTLCVGTPTENSIFTDYGEICLGITNGVSGMSTWYGESTNGNVLPLQGACYISNDSLIRAVDVSGVRSNLTTFGTAANIVRFQSNGKAVVNVSVVDAKPRKVYWFAIGEAALPEIGGIYYINPNKSVRSDSYYDTDRKIPNPKVRTALIGE